MYFDRYWFTRIMVSAGLGDVAGVSVAVLLLGTVLHEYLHAIPLILYGVPYLLSSTRVIYFPLPLLLSDNVSLNTVYLLLTADLQDLVAVFPYLFTSLIGLSPLIVGVAKKNTLLITMGITLIIIGVAYWQATGWHEYLPLNAIKVRIR